MRLGTYVLKQWPLFLTAIAFTLTSNQLSLMGPRYSGAAIDAIKLSGGVDFATVQENVGKMLLCYLLSAILSYVLAVIMVHLSQRIVYQMRKRFESALKMAIRFVLNQGLLNL